MHRLVCEVKANEKIVRHRLANQAEDRQPKWRLAVGRCVEVSGVAWVVRRVVRGGVCVVRVGIPIPNDGQKVVALTVFREKRALFAIIVFDKSKVANIETLQKE